jgi:hypothetical protein
METLTRELTRNGNGLWDVTQKPATPAPTDFSEPPKYKLEPADGWATASTPWPLRNIFHGDGSVLVRAGDRSGWLASDRSLSQHGHMLDRPRHQGSKDYARVWGYSQLRRRAILADNAFITGPRGRPPEDAQILWQRPDRRLRPDLRPGCCPRRTGARQRAYGRQTHASKVEASSLTATPFSRANAVVRSEEDLFISQGCFAATCW